MKPGWIAIALMACVLAPACDEKTPAGPSATDLTGTWTGTSTYPNAPFQLTLTQTGSTLKGNYSDRLDKSIGVTGTFSTPSMAIVVDFGDAKLNLDGSLSDARTIQGTMKTSALGNTPYPFTMSR